MTKYTEKEIQMLKAFYQTSIDICGACDENENMSYMNAQDLVEVLGWNAQEVGGVMSSLESKWAICDMMESYRGARINDFCIEATVAEWMVEEGIVSPE